MLALYLERQRRDREARAAALEAEARSYYVQLHLLPAPTRERAAAAEAIMQRLWAMAQKLREPPYLPRVELTPAQAVVMAGRHLPPVETGG